MGSVGVRGQSAGSNGKAIKGRKRRGPSAAQTSLTAGLVLSVSAFSAQEAEAQNRTPVPAPAPGNTIVLDPIDAQGTTPENTLQADTGIGRLPGRIQDIPQTVNVINQETIKQQNITSLDQAMRNVPGVTVAIGEGGGGQNGDQFRIRGFQAKGDVYSDGLRDFGVYVRDAFPFEQIQVIKGPTSESFGVGTTGGAINSVQKTARKGNFISADVTGGNGPMGRAVIDVNRQINDTTALRAVVMGHKQDLVDRDHLYSDRWGILLASAFGLGTSTTLTVNYMHQTGTRIPDFGVPISALPSRRLALPVTEYAGIRRSNYYGKETDRDHHNVDMLTARYKNELYDWLTVSNDTRVARYDRYLAQTVTSCNAACALTIQNGTLNGAYSFGGPAGYVQDSWGWQNITTALMKFNTGPLRHELVTGLDVNYIADKRTQLAFNPSSAARNAGTIGNPEFRAIGYNVYTNSLALKDGNSWNVAGFISDRIWFAPQWSVVGGVRYDTYRSTYSQTAATTGIWGPQFTATTGFASPKASLIWEPTPDHNFYVSWARSYSNVGGQFITGDNAPLDADSVSLVPEESTLWEGGTKLNFFSGRLGLTGAVFEIEKKNSLETNAVTGSVTQTNETQRVRGVEVGATGQITQAWNVQAAYTYLDSTILNAASSVAAQATVGNRVAFVPEHSASFWTTYELSKHIPMRGKLLIGGGMNYVHHMFSNSANTSVYPAYHTYDGLISYEFDKYRLQLNAYNLTDELYYVAQQSNRAAPAPGRTIMLTAGVTFN